MEDIVKALNNFIKNNYNMEGHFVGHQSYTVDKTFKSFRHYMLRLYYISKGKNYPIIEEDLTLKIEDDSLLKKSLNIKFLEAIYDYVASDEFRDLVYGNINI